MEKEGVALRGLFIIDPSGILRQITINDLPIGRSVDESLRLLDALKFVEEHGEGTAARFSISFCTDGSVFISVCPANWRQGEKTIKPDPKGSKEYFETVTK